MSAMGLVTTLPSAVQQANLNLDFLNQKYSVNGVSKTFDQLVTNTRASTACYYGADGLIKTAAANVSRFEYDPVTLQPAGFLIEEARTNMTSYSSTFINGVWGKTAASVYSNVAVAPDGTYTADKLIEDTSTSVHSITRSIAVAVSTTYTWSVFLKAAERTSASIQFGNFANQVASNAVYINLLTGETINNDANRTRVQALSNGWFRVSATVTTTATGTSIFPSIYTSITFGSNNYTGDGRSGIYIWGGSMELGAFPTSHIPTPVVFTSRASTATYYDNIGVLQTAASGVARSNAYTRDSTGKLIPIGLLTENTSTNLVTRSAEFDNAGWAKARTTVTANQAIAPDGTMSMDLVLPTNVSGDHQVSVSVAATASTNYVWSCYLKAAGYNWGRLRVADSVSFLKDAVVDLVNGTIYNPSNISTIEPVGNGIWRVSVAVTTQAAATTISVGVWVYDNTRTSTFVGDGVSGIYVWGAQLETGNVATSYIPTTSATVVRAADVTSSSTATRAHDAPSVALDATTWFNPNEFTVYGESQVITPKNETSVRQYEMSTAADNNNRAGILYQQGFSTAVLQVVGAGATSASIASAAFPSNSVLRTASALKVNDFAVSFNGATTQTDTSGVMPTGMDRLYIGVFRTGVSNQPCGYIRNIQVFNRRLSNSILQVLSS